MPVLQKAVSDMFTHCDILNSINPEEVIAIGAAKQACYRAYLPSKTGGVCWPLCLRKIIKIMQFS